MLAARDIEVTLGGAPVLQGVSLALAPGEVLAVIGPNGAGKSTLLHVLSGALKPWRGAVSLDGRALPDWNSKALARRRAVLGQSPSLTFPFRVLDVVLLGRSPHAGRSRRESDLAIAEAALRETDTLHLAARAYTTLSGGERQRVQLARVLAQVWPEMPEESGGEGPRYLLLDEPTNNLDIAHQLDLMATARRFAARGHGVLAVLHDPNLAALNADRICALRDGRLLAEGPPDAIVTPTLFKDAFGVDASIAVHPDSGRPVMLPA